MTKFIIHSHTLILDQTVPSIQDDEEWAWSFQLTMLILEFHLYKPLEDKSFKIIRPEGEKINEE